jgi:dTMP kinase
MFVSLDGVDGVGKSTQIALLVDWLQQRGYELLVCRDPGGTELGEQLREVLLTQRGLSIGIRAEMLMYMAARAQLVEERIRPALQSGKIVISDRFLLANVVYQGYGAGLDVEQVWQVGQIATAGVLPTLTILLDLPAATALARLGSHRDRMEARGVEYLERVRKGFLVEAARQSNVVVIDAAEKVDVIQEQIRTAVARQLSTEQFVSQ